MNIGNSIHVGELKLAEGIEVLTDADATVCVCAAPKAVVEEVKAEVVADATAEPEVIRKAKADEEAEEKK